MSEPSPRRAAALLVLICALAAPARAEVVDASSGGFAVKTAVDVSAVPRAAYLGLVVWIGSWWDPEHTYSGDARNLSIDPRAGGCWCEKLPNNGAVEHMRIVWLEPEKTVRLVGALGPLQEMPVTGVMTWTFMPGSAGTKIEMTYAAGGYAKGGFETTAKAVDQVLTTQVQRLKRFLETGKIQ
jgi:hypothetical protein